MRAKRVGRSKRKCLIYGTILIVLLGLFLIFLAKSSPPKILSASVYPTKVRPGEVMLVTVAVKGSVTSVTAENTHNLGKDKINLQLKKIENGTRIYEGSWIVHDTTGQLPYRTYITVKGKLGQIAEERVEWLDPTVTHSASQVTAGTFGAGDYVFPNNLNVSGEITGTTEELSVDSLSDGQGHVLLMHFNNDSAVGERYNTSNGTVIYDYSNAKNNGTLYTGANNGITYSATGGKFNGAFTFDGKDDWVQVADKPEWDFGSNDFTVEWWENRKTDGGTVIGRDATTDITPFLFGYSTANKMYVYMTSNGASWDIANAKSLGNNILNAWTHYAVVRSGNTFYAYQNYVMKDTWTSSSALNANANPLSIGRVQTNSYFNGTIDEVAIYNYSLGASQILDHYKKGFQNVLEGETIIRGDTKIQHNLTIGEGLTISGQSRVRAYLTTAPQSIPSGVWTKVTLNAESYDNQNEFDSTTNYRFTAKTAGYYLITTKAYFSGITDGIFVGFGIYKNGALASYSLNINGATGDMTSILSDILYLVANDYIEIVAYHSDVAARNIVNGEWITYMAIHRLS